MAELLHTPVVVLHIVVCIMLMLVVLIQPGKSGGLGAALGGAGAQQIFGGRGAGNFLTRTTWIAASVFFFTSVTLAYVSTSTGDSLEDLAADVQAETAPEPPPAEKPAGPAEPAAGAAADPAPAPEADPSTSTGADPAASPGGAADPGAGGPAEAPAGPGPGEAPDNTPAAP